MIDSPSDEFSLDDSVPGPPPVTGDLDNARGQAINWGLWSLLALAVWWFFLRRR
jgi:hypothetical protein